jgi:hypothetical protein
MVPAWAALWYKLVQYLFNAARAERIMKEHKSIKDQFKKTLKKNRFLNDNFKLFLTESFLGIFFVPI